MNNPIAVTIAILTYNRAVILDNLLKSLSSLTYKPLEIIVVDNNSQDETEMVVKHRFPRYIYHRMNRNIGAAARNFGIDIANGEIIICLDDDVFGIDDNQIKSVIKKFTADSSIGAINFKITDYFSGNLCNWAHHCVSEDFHDKTFITYEITEGAVAFRKSALNVAGGYPEYFFLSHEGPDLAFRLIDNGYKVIYSGDIVVRHSHSNLGRKTWTNYYYDTRNALWFAIRNLPFGYMLKYLGKSYLSTMIYAVRDGFLKYWLKAIWDGIAGLPLVWRDRKVVKPNTMKAIREIDIMRPHLSYLIKQRLSSKNARL
jgi:GT2 family glycosyltransferase